MDLLKCLLSSIRIAAMQKNKSFPHHDIIKTVKEDEHPQPIVCIIGTHADGLKENLKDVTSHVNKKICELEVLKKNDNNVMIIWSDSKGIYLRPVDNTVPRDLQERLGLQNSITADIQAMTIKTIENIRDSSKKVLEKKMQYEIPISWFIIELELRKFCEKNKKVCISLDDIKKNICDNIMESDSRMEKRLIIEIMKFYHMFGTLLFFDEVNGMNEFVITDPQWLFTNLTEIITCICDENHVCYDANHINKLRNEGICNIDLLRNLKNLQDIEMESFLKLLVHLKVIAPMDHNEYFIPSVLPRLNRKIDNKSIFNEEDFGKAVAFTADGHTIKVDPLLIEFTFGTIPRGLFGFLAVQILQDNPLYELYSDNDPDNNIYYCCADLITFQVDPCWYVTLIDNISYLELQVRVQEENRTSYHQQIQKTVTAALKKVCDQFDWQFSDCRYGFSCKICFKKYSNMDHLSVLSTEEPIPSQLPDRIKCSRKHTMKLKEKHKLWFKDIVLQPDDKIIIESFDCSTVEKMLRKEYDQLSHLPYKSMDKKLFAYHVITTDEKLQIEGKIGTEQMAKLLDIIIESLKLKRTTKYLGFRKAMEESEDTDLNQIAKKLATVTVSSRCDSSEALPKKPADLLSLMPDSTSKRTVSTPHSTCVSPVPLLQSTVGAPFTGANTTSSAPIQQGTNHKVNSSTKEIPKENLMYTTDDLVRKNQDLSKEDALNEVADKQIIDGVLLLLMIANDNELDAAKYYFSKSKVQVLHSQNNIYHIGKWGEIPAALVKQSEQGTSGPDGSQDLTRISISVFKNLKVIIALGVCGTMGRLGDVIVSSRIDEYKFKVLGKQLIPRGNRFPPGSNINKFLQYDNRIWSFQCTKPGVEEYKSKAVFQPMLSGTPLIASGEYRDHLIKDVSEEAGGVEMEGIGIINGIRIAGKSGQIEFVIVKAGCDYANELKNKEWQPVAAMAAADFVYKQLNKKIVHEWFKEREFNLQIWITNNSWIILFALIIFLAFIISWNK